MTFLSTSPAPALADELNFQARACLLRLRRTALEFAGSGLARRRRVGTALADAPVVAEVRSALWTNGAGAKDFALTAGKVHNLRVALRGVDGIVVPAGEIFSFWSQVGRPSRRRGFVEGRELREGCLIPSPGAGLCHFSNPLPHPAQPPASQPPTPPPPPRLL